MTNKREEIIKEICKIKAWSAKSKRYKNINEFLPDTAITKLTSLIESKIASARVEVAREIMSAFNIKRINMYYESKINCSKASSSTIGYVLAYDEAKKVAEKIITNNESE